MRKRMFDLEEVEGVAAKCGTKSKTGKALGLGKGSIFRKIKTDAEFREAVERGLKTFKANKKTATNGTAKPAKAKTAKYETRGMKETILRSLESGPMVLGRIRDAIDETPTLTQMFLNELKGAGEIDKKFDKRIQRNIYFLPESAPEPIFKKSDRDLVLDAIKGGNNLVRQIMGATGLDDHIILDELHAMMNLEVEVYEGLNFDAYFIKGELPAGRLYLDGTGTVKAAEPKQTEIQTEPDSTPDIWGVENNDSLPEAEVFRKSLYEREQREIEGLVKDRPIDVTLDGDDILELGPIGSGQITIDFLADGAVTNYQIKDGNAFVLELIQAIQYQVDMYNRSIIK